MENILDAVELGSLSKVAMLHNTNQPQISRQMNELEAQCGGRLFNRTGRGVELHMGAMSRSCFTDYGRWGN